MAIDRFSLNDTRVVYTAHSGAQYTLPEEGGLTKEAQEAMEKQIREIREERTEEFLKDKRPILWKILFGRL